MSATPHDGSGTTFSFAGTTYTVTNIVINNAELGDDTTIDVSHLGLTTGNDIKTIKRPLKGSASDTGREVVIEYLGVTELAHGTTGTLAINSPAISKGATVVSSTLTLAVNDAVRGTATFRVAN